MSKERELIKDMKILLECTDMGGLQRNADVLIGRAIELLAQPEQEGVYQKLLRIEDGIEVEILPSELWQDGYETGKRTMQPEQEPDLWVVTNPWGVNEYLWSEPRKHIYKTYKVTKFYRSPPVNKHNA